MKKTILIFSLLFIYLVNLHGQQVKLEGIYTGKQIYIHNGVSEQGNCTEKVVINNKEVPFNNGVVFEINPGSLGFHVGDTLKITIYHKPGCEPYAIIDNATPKTDFQITSISLDKQGMLKWIAIEKNNKNPFIIQQFIHNKWTKIGEVKSIGDGKENEYSLKITFDLNDAEFRLMQVDELGRTKYSKSVSVSH